MVSTDALQLHAEHMYIQSHTSDMCRASQANSAACQDVYCSSHTMAYAHTTDTL